ncbi:4-(cytidine 5'-diphospho)-2-C-methyl-D-erythritol kinase [Paludibacter sp. 221]|uniref:4-(cytidine 5'-diphospho)-2-C-methyl-D-erythritol kinase n=1 Tax=Paludibacter sp. 221 TaxID=2302939 RepID=UPI0013CF58EC|nr:4-(cytidine 5'-diphospho)-2-C-methyl-D-erythritol kinase [Paludibacter sp. 221]NDV47724.1 4-(cytidine 5'-diphospho)-2-C-methyl-D-erythritol kinase [Paludibacter sp. 221]
MIVHPNAKINIGLNVTEKRSDGYHNIETVFYPIGLSDVLEVSPSETCIDYSFSSDGFTIEGDPENNLVVKAYRLLQSEYELPAIDISLIKQVPFGAGLGGGSSDAAFMLKVLNDLFNLNLPVKKLEQFAVELGADCPFFIRNKPVFASGTGNVFSPVKLSLKDYFLILVKPDIHVSTPQAYSLITPQKPETSLKELITTPMSEWRNLIVNDFEKPVFSLYPEIGEIKDNLYNLGAIYASMSGSGSSVYGIFESPVKESDVQIFSDYFISGGYLS